MSVRSLFIRLLLVWMMLQGRLMKGFLNFSFGGIISDPQDLVRIVIFVHRLLNVFIIREGEAFVCASVQCACLLFRSSDDDSGIQNEK
jgi:hypothetical protein